MELERPHGRQRRLRGRGRYLLILDNSAELAILPQDAKAFEPHRRYRVADTETWAHPVPTKVGILIKELDSLALGGKKPKTLYKTATTVHTQFGREMKRTAKQLSHLTRAGKGRRTAELSMSSTIESSSTWQIKLRGIYSSFVERRGFMN